MGSSSSKKPEITVQAIRSNTQDIRSSLRRKQVPLQSKEELHKVLVNNSKQLDNIRAKKSKKRQLEIDQIQKLVRDVNEELLFYNDDHLDKNADESHSFIHVEGDQLKKRKKSPVKTTQGRRNSRDNVKTKRPMNINQIEQNLSVVKETVTTALKNNDLNCLKTQKIIIEELSTDLELLRIQVNSSLHNKKIDLEKDLKRYYQKIIKREKNIDKQEMKQSECETDTTEQSTSKLRHIELLLEDIHDALQNTVKGDNRGDLKEINEELTKIENELNKIQKTDSNEESKTLLMKKVIQSEEFVKEIEKKKEMNELDELMDEIDKLKTEIQIQKETNKGKVIQEIEAKQRKLTNFEVKHLENKKFKDDYLEELAEFIEKIFPKDYSIVLRQKKLKSSKSVEDLIHLQSEWSNLQENISEVKLDEVKRINDLLQKFEESIRAKRKSLENMMKNSEPERNRRKSAEIIRTSARIYDLPRVETTKSNENEEKIAQPISTPMKYGSVEYVLGVITKISDRVEEIGKEILNFDGTTENLEYNFFTAALIDKKTILKNLKHRTSWNQVDSLKNEVLEKTEFYEEYLKYKLNQNVAEEKVKEMLDNIEKEIIELDGSIQNIQALDAKLSTCQKEVIQIDNKEKNEWFKHRLSHLGKILKDKSLNEENLTDTKKIIAESAEYIRTLKKDVENAYALNVNQCALIEECLMNKTLELINLNVKNDTPSFSDIKKLLKEIDDCKVLMKSKQKTLEELQKGIEEELDGLQMDISFFEGLPNDETFLSLMQKLENLELKLCSIRGTDESSEKNLEISLRINFLKNRLEKLALVSEKMLFVEKRVRELLEIVSEGVPKGDFDKLDEELINTKIEVEKLEVSEKLSYRKITCLSYIEYLMKKINEKSKGSVQISSGILV